jgi:hypothetical protein
MGAEDAAHHLPLVTGPGVRGGSKGTRENLGRCRRESLLPGCTSVSPSEGTRRADPAPSSGVLLLREQPAMGPSHAREERH